MLHQPLLVLGKGRGIEGRVYYVQIQKPLEQQVVLQPLIELVLTAYRVQSDEQTYNASIMLYKPFLHVYFHLPD